jgi:subtilisin family serine protease
MNRLRSWIRCLLVAVVCFLLFRSVPAQTDSPSRLSGMLRLIQQRYASAAQSPSADSRSLRTDPAAIAFSRLVAMDLDGTEPVLPVLVVVRDDGAEMRREGFRILAQIGDVVTTRVPASRLSGLANLPSVVFVEASTIQHPLVNDVSVPETKAVQARQAYNLTGKGVIVGVIDTGIDWRHDDFRTADGKTRIKYLWDMSDSSGPEPSDLPGTGGRVYTEAQINAALSGSGTVAEADRHGHGTHVTGTAAGNGRATGGGFPAGTFTGVAPEASIVFVKGLRSDSGGFAVDDQVAALRFIDNRARELNMPYVVNMSIGGHYGAHDGTATNERAIDNLVGAGAPGKAICVSAGNEGADNIHASGTLGSGASDSVGVYVPSSKTFFLFDLWYSGSNSIEVTVTTPTGLSTNAVAPGGSFQGSAPDGTVVEIGSENTNALNGARNISVIVSHQNSNTAILSGQWKIALRNTAGGAVRFDAWLSGRAEFVDHVDPGRRVGMPATARDAISVASYVSKVRWTDYDGTGRDYRGWGPAFDAGLWEKSPFSSPGPTRDGRRKPDIAAPGQAIASANSADAEFDRSMVLPDGGKHQVMQGTSMASPHVTGVVALLLQANKSLDAAQIKDLITRTARADDYTSRVPNDDFGYGKIDAYEAAKAIIGNSGAKPPTPAPVITSVEPATIAQGTTVQLGINGANFAGAITATVTPQSGVTINQLGMVSSARVEMTLGVAPSAAAGTYQVVLKSGGTSSNPGLFRVVDPNAPNTDTGDNFEPNDTLEAAKPLPANGVGQGRINPRADIDVYKFSATQGRKVTIDIDAASLSPASPLDSIIGVFDSYGNLLDFSDDDGRSLDSYLEWTPSVTTAYYIVVASYSDSENGPTSSGNYVLRVSGFAGDVKNDVTIPVLDPAAIFVPDFLNTTDELFASWYAYDNESGIDHYEYAVGTAPGAANVIPFTRTNNWSVVLRGLNLSDGGEYFFGIRPVNGAGLAGPLAISQGIRIETTRRMYPIYFPRVVAFPGSFTGIALSNRSAFPVQVIYRLYDNEGNLAVGPGISNPLSLTLNPGEQLPVLSTQIFDVPSGNIPGWVEVQATSPDVRAFYLYGSDDLSFLDGADVSGTANRDFVFHRVQDDGNNYFTSISLVNPNLTEASLTAELRDVSGRVVATRTTTLAARKRMVKLVRDLFPGVTSHAGGTIRVRSNVGLVGFELFATEALDFGGMNPQRTNDTAGTVSFAQMATRSGWYTQVSLTNPNDSAVTVQLTAMRDTGDIIPASNNPRTVQIPAWGQYNAEAAQVFGFPGTQTVVGYIVAKVVSGSSGIFGHVAFGTSNGKALAALPIQTQGSRAMVFSQVAQGGGFSTGLTLLNPDANYNASVTTEVFDADGRSRGAVTETFRPGEKKARVINEVVSGVIDQGSGYIVVTADRPVIGFELFWGLDSSNGVAFLAAVPPQMAASSSAPETAVSMRAPASSQAKVLQLRRSASGPSPATRLHRAVASRTKGAVH